MTDLIDRAARAAYEAYAARVPANVPWDFLSDGEQNIAKAQVRAVLEAIREPTGPMLEAVLDDLVAWECFKGDGASWSPAGVFTTMIDAALKEPE